MRSYMPVKVAKTGYVLISAAYCFVGLFLLLFPHTTVAATGMVLSIAMIVCGVIKVGGYFSKDLYRLAFQHDLAFGILLIALGIPILARPDVMLQSLCVIAGIAALADGLLKVQTAMDARRFGLGSWIGLLVPALATCVLGVLLVLHPAGGTEAFTMLIGATVLVQGIVNLITGIFMVKVVRNQRQDVIEINDIDAR